MSPFFLNCNECYTHEIQRHAELQLSENHTLTEFGINRKSRGNVCCNCNLREQNVGMVITTAGDTVSGASISVEGFDKITGSSERGEYWRLLPPGRYFLFARKGRRKSQVLQAMVKKKNVPTILNFVLS